MLKHNLLIFYRSGEIVNQDYEKALFWYFEAAVQEYPKAQYYVGLFYYEGYGVPQDKEKGLFWMTKAKQNGYSFADAFLKRVLKN